MHDYLALFRSGVWRTIFISPRAYKLEGESKQRLDERRPLGHTRLLLSRSLLLLFHLGHELVSIVAFQNWRWFNRFCHNPNIYFTRQNYVFSLNPPNNFGFLRYFTFVFCGNSLWFFALRPPFWRNYVREFGRCQHKKRPMPKHQPSF